MTPEQKEKHIESILKIIESEKIFTFKDIFVFYKGCSRATAYNNEFDKLDDIREAIDMNKRRGVQSLLDRWIDSDNATLQIAAFRVIADPEERNAISQSYKPETQQVETQKIIVEIVDPKHDTE